MSQIVEVTEDGALYLPPEVLSHPKPHTRFVVQSQDGSIVLHPVEGSLPFWATATPHERAEALRRFASEKRPPAPPIPLEALRRENLYD
ncbi:MAG: hypothetical protein M3347_00955 [Armatimonadota bacterium]|nr:hypothetical protein [Armatimonadota bacterium]